MCHWNFHSPSVLHFLGLWEATVKSTKSLLIRSLGAQTWTLEEISTILCRVEAALNSGPLTPVTPDLEDLDCLSLGHFLIGQPLMSVPEELHMNPINLQ